MAPTIPDVQCPTWAQKYQIGAAPVTWSVQAGFWLAFCGTAWKPLLKPCALVEALTSWVHGAANEDWVTVWLAYSKMKVTVSPTSR